MEAELSVDPGFGKVLLTNSMSSRRMERGPGDDVTILAGERAGSGPGRWRRLAMATFERPKTTDKLPPDLIPVIRTSGILGERQLAEIKSKVLRGEYPLDPIGMAERLVRDEVLTVYQAKRFLNNKPHGLLVGRYIILDRIGSGSMGRV